jgi:hypothetical protein
MLQRSRFELGAAILITWSLATPLPKHDIITDTNAPTSVQLRMTKTSMDDSLSLNYRRSRLFRDFTTVRPHRHI